MGRHGPADRKAEPADLPPGRRPGRREAGRLPPRPSTSPRTASPTRYPSRSPSSPCGCPRRTAIKGNLLTAFHVVPQSYVKEAGELYHFRTNGQRAAANDRLFQFLSAYRISPASWGFGEPRYACGLHVLAEVVARRRREHGPPEPGRLPDDADPDLEPAHERCEPDRRHFPVRARQLVPVPAVGPQVLGRPRLARPATPLPLRARRARPRRDEPRRDGRPRPRHSCFPGSKVLVTGNPTSSNRFLWDNKGGDDVDIWVGAVPPLLRPVRESARADPHDRAGAPRRQSIWSYTFDGPTGTPGYALTEPLSDPRMFLLWNALEGIRGTLYGAGRHLVLQRRRVPQPAVTGRVRPRLPGRGHADCERAARADPRRDRGLGHSRHRPPEARRDCGSHGSWAMPACSAPRHRA